jgi:hypothetical protein
VINLILVMIFLATGTAYAEQAGCSATPGKEISRWAIKTSVVNPASKPIAIKLVYLMELDNPPVDKAMRKQLLTGRLARQLRGKVKEGDIVMIEGYLQGGAL